MKSRKIAVLGLCISIISFAGCNEKGTNGLSGATDTPSGNSAADQEFAAGEIIQLTEVADRANRLEPDVDGDRIVWLEQFQGGSSILLYDLLTKEGRLITSVPLILDFNPPKISGDRIVWAGGTPGLLTYYNLANDTEMQLESILNQNQPEIFGDRIVWRAVSPRVQFDIHLYDLEFEVETPIAFEEGDPQVIQDSPVIWGDIIAWTDRRNLNNDIFIYDLTNDTETPITDEEANQYTPAIWENRIVWVDERNGNADIFMYDLSTGTETQITDNPADQIDPAIFGDIIVWEDFRNGNSDIFLYNLATSTESQITFDVRDQFDPAISGNTLVWAGICESMIYSDIFIYKIPNGDD